MDTFLKKYFWTLQLGAAVVVGLLLAAAVNAFIGSRFVSLTIALPGADGTAVAEDPAGATQTLDLPAAVFGTPPVDAPPPDPCADVTCDEGQVCNATTGECELAVAVEEVAEPVGQDGRCLESDIAINLVGTMVSADPRYSMAVLRNPSTNKTQFAREGTNLLAEADVLRVERTRVILRRNGREECLRFGDQATRAARGAASNPTPAVPMPPRTALSTAPSSLSNMGVASAETPRGATIEERMQTGVRRNADGSYDIDRSLIAEVANNQSVMQQQAPQVVPNYVNGAPRGFRLQGVRSGSMFSRIGIRNGDVIVSVGDTLIDSPQRALALYESMMSQPQVSVTVLRRGREQQLVYNIR